MKKLGTIWVSLSEGLDLLELSNAIETMSSPKTSLSAARKHLYGLSLKYKTSHKTNIGLTGEPLSAYDLRRIAVCE